MIDMLLMAQKGLSFTRWIELNPFAGVLLLTFVLLAIVTVLRPRFLEDAEQEKEAKDEGATVPTVKEAAEAAPAAKAEPVKAKAPAKPEKQEKPKKPKKPKKQKAQKAKATPEPEVAPPPPEVDETPAPEAEVAEPSEEPKTDVAVEEPSTEPAKALVEEAPEAAPEVAEEAPEETPIPEEVPAEEPVEEPKKPEKKAKKDEPTDDDLARQKKLEERQKKRTMHVSEVAFKEDNTEPRTLRDGLSRTRKGWVSKLGDLLKGKKELDDDVLEDLEEILYSADIGTRTVQRLLQTIEDKLERDELSDPEKVKDAIKDEIYQILDVGKPALDFAAEQPFVVMVVGVNGVGKTTTIGKVAARLSNEGKKVLVGAADTFRAAAVEQLELWASRTDAEIIKGQPNQDPSSVVFDAVQAGVARNVDIVIADTAGRLHTNQNLMQELKKIKRVMGRACASSPHEVLLVLDATTGQNAINQAKEFNEALGVTGIALTKLDGSAKGGVIVAICEELKIPIRYVGVGEHIDELKRFSAAEFVDALF